MATTLGWLLFGVQVLFEKYSSDVLDQLSAFVFADGTSIVAEVESNTNVQQYEAKIGRGPIFAGGYYDIPQSFNYLLVFEFFL